MVPILTTLRSRHSPFGEVHDGVCLRGGLLLQEALLLHLPERRAHTLFLRDVATMVRKRGWRVRDIELVAS